MLARDFINCGRKKFISLVGSRRRPTNPPVEDVESGPFRQDQPEVRESFFSRAMSSIRNQYYKTFTFAIYELFE